MARFSPPEVDQKISQLKLLPLFNTADVETCVSVIDSCYDAGIRAFELTNRDAHALEVFRKLQQILPERWPELSLGAGTIMDTLSCSQFIEAGADFIIAPELNPAVGQFCLDAGIPWIPGAFTPTEIKSAYDQGAFLVKLFPAGTVGPSYIRHIHGPMPFAKIIVTGGVETDERALRSWLDAGVYAIGLGSSMFKKEWLVQKSFDLVTEALKSVVKVAESYKR